MCPGMMPYTCHGMLRQGDCYKLQASWLHSSRLAWVAVSYPRKGKKGEGWQAEGMPQRGAYPVEEKPAREDVVLDLDLIGP